MVTTRLRRRLLGTGLALLCISLAPGCAYLQSFLQPAPPPAPARQPSSTLAAGTGTAPLPSSSGPAFYQFEDIPVPRELTYLPGESYVFEAGKTRAGVLTLKGRVDVNSLIKFFELALPRRKWEMKGMLRGRRSVLVFQKPEKAAIFKIHENTFTTYVEIYVIPFGRSA